MVFVMNHLEVEEQAATQADGLRCVDSNTLDICYWLSQRTGLASRKDLKRFDSEQPSGLNCFELHVLQYHNTSKT